MEARADVARRRSTLVTAIALTLICIVCSSLALLATLLARREEAALATQAPAALPAEVTLVVATETPPATESLSSEAAQSPADTPVPVTTAKPVVFRGKGDEKVDVERGHEPSIAHISHAGSDHFSVINYDSDGQRMDLLVNTTGNYDGVVPIDFVAGEHTAQFRVEADGEWTIEILDLLAARAKDIPGVIDGNGDEVVFFNGGAPRKAMASASGSGSFSVWSYGSSYDLVVSEMAPYEGSFDLDPHAFFLVISADVPWSLSVAAGEWIE